MAGDLEIFRDCHSLPLKIETGKTSLVVQWLGPYAFTARGSIPGWETKILHAAQWGQKGERVRQLILLPELSGLFFFFTIFLSHCCCCLVTKSGTTLCNPMNCSPPGSSFHGISHARILELVPFPSLGDLPNSGIGPVSPALIGGFFTTEPPGKPSFILTLLKTLFGKALRMRPSR